MPRSEGRPREDDHLSVTAGDAALLRIGSMSSPLRTLPERAFDNLLVVSATRPPSGVERIVRERGGDPQTVGVVPVSGSPIEYDGPMWTAPVVSPNDLSGISDRFELARRYVKPGEGWVVVDNVNVLLMYAEQDTVYQLVRSLRSRTMTDRARGVFTIVPGALSENTIRRFESLFDVHVDRTGGE